MKSSSPPGSGVSLSTDAPFGSDVRPSSGARPNSGDAGCRSCTGGTTMTGGVSQVTSLVSTTLFARVSILNESQEWSMPGPR